jgi:prevent-host-death family protein
LKKINLHSAKTNLSKLIELAIQGEEVIICKAGNPVVKLVPFAQKKDKRKPGIWKDKVTITKDFDTLPTEFMEHFHLCL